MSVKGNRTLGIVNGTESYHTIKESFQSLFNEVNDLTAKGKMNVDGQEIQTELYLGGDYKFILLMLGLKGATSNYACAWCKTHKNDRWRINNDYTSYNTPPLARTLKEMFEMSKKSRDNYCCDKQPILNIPLDRIVVDELHLMLRITDILIGNLVQECLDWDKDDDLDHKKGAATGLHLKSLIRVIKSCGVSFDVWEQRNADGKGSGKHDWTSLLGKDKKSIPLQCSSVWFTLYDIQETELQAFAVYNIIIVIQTRISQVFKKVIHPSAHPCFKRSHHASILWFAVDFPYIHETFITWKSRHS